MRLFISIFAFFIVGCSSSDVSKYPSEFNKILAKKPFTLVVTYSVDCPVSQLYTSVLKDISASLPLDSFQCFLLKVNANENWDISMNRFIVIDSGALEIAQAIGFKVFPEVAVMNAEGEIQYIGAIDGRVKEIGNTHFKPLPSEMYLNNALTQLRKKQPINKPSTVAKGCFIEYNKNP
jgi:hypothetical protein